jgi:EmrB/QacA subfamily drug resistance transporter
MSTSSISPAVTQRAAGRQRARGQGGGQQGQDRRGAALALVLGAQLMIILDMTVVNIALPSIARGLHFSAPSLSWVLNAYTLTFGGLLLLGGRAGDILGRRRMFIAGIALFTAASLAGGLATSAAWLLAARAAQGVGGATASPAVLALISASFAEGRERTRAIGIYTAVAMGGGSLGLVLGGVITQWVSWRWVLFINVPIGIAVLLAAPVFLGESQRQPGRFDIAGALASTAGMTALVYGFIRAASDGWGNRVAMGAFAAAAILLALFIVNESRARQPITPLRLFADRSRAGSLLARLLIVAGMFGMFFFLTQFVQDILGFSPLRAGISFLPMTVVLFAVSRLSPQLLARFGPKILMVAGMLPVACGMAWLSRISPGTGYLAGVLGPMLLIGGGMGMVFVPLTMASLAGVRPEDSGAASSMVNVTQQVGGSLGLAILVTAFSTASRNAARHPLAHLARPAQAHQAVVHGMASAFTLSTVFDVCALLVVLVVISGRPRRPAAAAPGADVTADAAEITADAAEVTADAAA